MTLGQRRGLGLPGGGPKRYVVEIDQDTATVVVGAEEDLATDVIEVHAVTMVDETQRAELLGRTVLVQCSAHGEPRRAIVAAMDPTPGASMVLEWMRPETKVAPGQSIVLYELSDIQVIGGGRAVSSR